MYGTKTPKKKLNRIHYSIGNVIVMPFRVLDY
jgi:hypothetical protein